MDEGSPRCDVRHHIRRSHGRHHVLVGDNDWEWQPREAVLCKFKVFLFGCFLHVDEGACSSLVNSELLASDLGQFLRSQSEGLCDAGGICKLDEAELVLSCLVGILPSIPNSEVHDDATLVDILKELLQCTDVDLVDRMDPNRAVSSILIEIFHSFEKID